jgi:serine/threonine-protein kinase
MSPEQCRSAKVDARADIYSLGVMLFELLTGQLPFVSQSALGMMSMHCNRLPPLASTIKPGLPTAIDDVVNRALAKEPDERFRTAGEMAAAFRAALGGNPVSHPRGMVWPGQAQPASETEASRDALTLVEIPRASLSPIQPSRARDDMTLVEMPPASQRPAPTSPARDDVTLVEVRRVSQPPALTPSARDDMTLAELPGVKPSPAQLPPVRGTPALADKPPASQSPVPTSQVHAQPQIALLFALAGAVALIAVLVAAALTATG